MRYADKIPYVFILDYLTDADIVIKPMFGCHGIYASGKLCLFLMNREKPLIRREGLTDQRGIYVATTADHAGSLKKEFPKAEFESLKDKKVWILFPASSEHFEGYSIKACEMINAHDSRIGR